MKKSLWSTLVASCLVTSVAMAEEPSASPPVEVPVEVEVVDVQPEVVEVQPDVVEVQPEVTEGVEPTPGPEVTPEVPRIFAPFFRGRAVEKEHGRSPLDNVPFVNSNGEILEDANPNIGRGTGAGGPGGPGVSNGSDDAGEGVEDGVELEVMTFSTTGGVREDNPRSLLRGNNASQTGLERRGPRQISLDRASTELRARPTEVSDRVSQTPPRTGLLSRIFGERDNPVTPQPGSRPELPARERPAREMPVREVRQVSGLEFSESQRTYARQLAEIDALRDRAIQTGDAALLNRADALAARLRDAASPAK